MLKRIKTILFTCLILICFSSSSAYCEDINPMYRQGYTSHDIADVREKLREEAKKNTEKKEKEIKEAVERNIKKIKAMKILYESMEFAFTYTDRGLEYSLISEPLGEKAHYISTDQKSIRLATEDFFIRIYFEDDSYSYIKSYIPEDINLEREIQVFENIIYEEVDKIKQLVATKSNVRGKK